MNGTHFRDERIALRHVTNKRPDLFGVSENVFAKNMGGTGRRRVKTKECVYQRGLAGAIGTEETDGPTAQFSAQTFQNRRPPNSTLNSLRSITGAKFKGS